MPSNEDRYLVIKPVSPAVRAIDAVQRDVLKWSLLSVTALGGLYIVLQCVRHEYMPEFSWSNVAMISATMAGIGFLLTLALVGLVLSPGAMLQTGVFSDLDHKQRGVTLAPAKKWVLFCGLVLLPQAVCFGVFLVLGRQVVWNRFEAFSHALHLPLGLALLLLLMLPPALLAVVTALYIAARRSPGVRRPAALFFDSIGLLFPQLMALLVSITVLLILYGSIEDAVSAVPASLWVIMMCTVFNLAAFYPHRKRVLHAAILVVALLAFCWPLSHAVFSMLGLGNRRVEWVIVTSRAANALKQDKRFVLEEQDGGSYALRDAYLSLRLGDDILLSYSSADPYPPIVLRRADVIGLRLKPRTQAAQRSLKREMQPYPKSPPSSRCDR